MTVPIDLLLSAILPLILGVLMTIYWRSRKTYRGYGFWVLSNFSIGLGYVLLGLRNQIPDFFSMLIANALLIYGLVMIYDGIRLFFNRPAFELWNHLIFGLYILLHLYLTYINPNINARVVLISIALCAVEFRIAILLLHDVPEKLRQTCRATAIIFVFSALISLLRGIYALGQSQPIDMLSDRTLAALSFATAYSITIWTFYFFFLTSARLELDFEEARGILVQTTSAGQRKIAQLSLLEETSKRVVETFDESEIFRRIVDSLVNWFGYAEAAICLLVDGDQLEVTVINGTEELGYRVGYRQKVGEGIIGHAAETQLAYVSGDIEHDTYYYSIGKRSGSAVGVPMLIENQLLGILYVESIRLNAFNQEDVQTLRTLVSHAVTAIQKARLYARTQAQLRALSTMQSVSHTILSSLDLKHIFQSVVQLLKDTFNYTYISIYTIDEQVLRLGAQVGYPPDLIFVEIPLTKGIAGRTVLMKQTQFVPDVSRDPDFLRVSYEIESEICVPILKENKVLGILNVEAAPGHRLTENDAEVLTALAGPIAIAIENARLHAEFKKMAMTDALTSLPNRRAFDLTLENEVSRAARYDYPLALIIIDMDSFKEFNDEWGHPAGDERLKAVADLLRAGIRNPDVAARYGGEEFALILPYTPKSSALILAERLRAAAESCIPDETEHETPISGYTFSMGVAAFPEDGKTVQELLLGADQAELTAKKLGKNRVCAAKSNTET